jgi:hypothetical protein
MPAPCASCLFLSYHVDRLLTLEFETKDPAAVYNSGKLLILAMLAAGVLAAASSWLFRFGATHEAAQYWGPEAVRLIRDAPNVELVELDPAAESFQVAARRNISAAPGMTHLRHALLEDRSFHSFDVPLVTPPAWHWAIEFRDGDDSAALLFSEDCAATTLDGAATRPVASAAPIAAGLREVFAEFAAPARPAR